VTGGGENRRRRYWWKEGEDGVASEGEERVVPPRGENGGGIVTVVVRCANPPRFEGFFPRSRNSTLPTGPPNGGDVAPVTRNSTER
jgi:hypothetical protein